MTTKTIIDILIGIVLILISFGFVGFAIYLILY